MVNLGDVFENHEVDTTVGRIKILDYFGGGWGILFSHPADFTPICTTELGEVLKLTPEFKKRGVKTMALSCNTLEEHKVWLKDLAAYAGVKSADDYPIIADPERHLAVKLGMIDPDERTKKGMPLTCRAVFVIGPDKKVKMSMLYPATTGRNLNEVLRVIDSLQLVYNNKTTVGTPVNWQNGDKCMLLPCVSKDEEKKNFPNTKTVPLPSKKEYLRFTPQPKK